MFESSCFHGEALTLALAVESLQTAFHGIKKGLWPMGRVQKIYQIYLYRFFARSAKKNKNAFFG